VLPYAVLFLEVLLFHRRVLFYLKWSIPFDIRGYHLPLAFQAAESLGAGKLPLWDPYTYCGFPFYANINTQLFYPPAWPFFALAHLFGFASLSKLLEWQTALHVFLAGAFAYCLLRKMNLRRGSALFGATIFQLGGYFSSQAQHLGAMCAAAWLPLAWLGVMAIAERFSWRWLAGLSGALAMSILAGFPPATIVVFGSTLLFAALLVLFRRTSWRLLVSVVAASVWAGLLSSVQLIPTLTLVPPSVASLRPQWHTTGGVPLQALVSLVAPNYYHIFNPDQYQLPFNFTFMYVYCSIAGLLLALTAVIVSRQRLTVLFLVMTVVCGIWMVGSNTPLIGTYYKHIPDVIRGPMYAEFAMAAFILGISVMAALGADRLIASRGKVAIAALIALAAADLTIQGSGRVLNTARTIDDPGVTPEHFEGSRAALARMRELAGQSFPPARLDMIGGSRNWTSFAPVMHLPTANGDQPLALLRMVGVRSCFAKGFEWERYYWVEKLDSKVINLLNIRYLLASESDDQALPRNPSINRIGTAGNHSVYENRDALPRFFLVGAVRRTHDFNESLAEVCSPSFDPANLAIVEGAGELKIQPRLSGLDQVRALEYSADFIELEVNTDAPSFLVSSEAWYPGWRARVNGDDARIWITNAAFRGIAVPAGHSRITMKFSPPDLVYGALVSIFAWLLFGIVYVAKR